MANIIKIEDALLGDCETRCVPEKGSRTIN